MINTDYSANPSCSGYSRNSPLVLVASENPPQTYLNALKRISLPFEATLSPDNSDRYCGLLLIGGGDILPAYYGGKTPSRNVNFVKDKLEFNLLEAFSDKQKPVLAICRGFQLANVFFGGTLRRVYGHCGKTDVFHPVSSASGFFGDLTKVNSAHRQAVDIVPEAAEILSVAPDLCVEAAIYGKNVICTQFHPERLSASVSDKIFGIFGKFVAEYACASRTAAKNQPRD